MLDATLWEPLDLTALDDVSISTSTGEKPQSKVWEHGGSWWSVLPNSSGTWLWRLNDTSWNAVVQLSGNDSTQADVKVVGNLAHILMFQGSSSELVTMEWSAGAPTGYDFWALQPNVVEVPLGSSVEIATMDVDSTGRMWIAYDRSSTIEVRYSDNLYTSFSAPITVASGISSDDLSSIVAMPGKVGVMWSNQNSQRFGFRTHVDGTNAQTWTSDEVPASQSAQSKGGGFADDHIHLAVTSDGTLYSAVKTSYDSSGYPAIMLLVRRPNGSWDNAYTVDTSGTRPIVVISEAQNELAVIYTNKTGGGSIVLRGSELGTINLGPEYTVISGTLDDVTSSKASVNGEIVVLATRGGSAAGRRIALAPAAPVNAAPVVSAGADQTITLPAAATLSGSATDDGLPSGSLTRTWSKVSGPGTVTFGDASSASTTATFSLAGTYVLRLTASDGSLQASDDVTIVVQDVNSPPPEPPPSQTFNGLVGWWTMDSGGTDSSGLGNNGSPSGSTSYVAGQAGNALRVSSNGRLVVPDHSSLDMTNTITMAAWIRPERTGTQYFIDKKDYSAVDGYELSLSSGGKVFVRFNQDSSGDTYRVNSTSSYPTNGQTWMHVAATYDGSTIRLYINGQLQGSKAASFQIGSNNVDLGLGAEFDGYRGMTGALDDVRIYDRALSAQEILALTSTTPPPAPQNTAPVVNAGADQSITLPNGVSLSGTASDDGLPSPAALSTTWSSVSGPGTVTFANANALSTTATFSQAGTYVLQLTASDGSLQASDQLTVQVQTAPPPQQNTAPLVNAGADQSITLPASATLSGTASDDGLPSPAALATTWSSVSGPGTVTFANANSPNTTATFSQAGTYVLQLTASDGSLQSTDQVTVQVQSAPQPSDGLVGWWSMDGDLLDQSGLSNHGTLSGSGSYTAGRISSAMLLASSGSRVLVSDNSSLDITQTITMAAWIQPTKTATQYVIAKKEYDSVNGYELSLSSTGKVFVRFNQDSNGDSYRVNSSSSYPTNGTTWMHVAATYDGATIRLYINGQLQASKSASFQIAANDLQLSLGAEADGYRGMTGALDDVRIYNRALSSQEIAALAAP